MRGNVFFTQKNMKWKIDWLKFKKLFPKNSKFQYFTAFDIKNSLQIKHNSFLANNKFKLFTKPLHLIAGNHKGNMDVELAWEICKNIPNLQTFVLVSGDGDFEYILSDLKNNFKKNVLVIGSQSNTNYKLIQNFHFLSLEKLQRKIEFKQKIPPVGGSSLVNQP
jgi:uncharacterized LabA/DUF88 family protein